MLAQLILFENPPEAARLLENVDDPRYSESTEAVRTIARLHEIIQKPVALPPSPVQQLYLDAVRDLFAQDFDAALRKLIEVIRLDRYYDDDGSRKACIAIFKILGEEHETTVKYRRDFSSALYV
jgi:putative thioredoxin